MNHRGLYWGIGVTATLVLSASAAFSQVQATQNRIPQQVSINGQMVNGAYVTTASGQLQGYTCPTPQAYKTADGSSQGWACYDQTTGVWLLNAAAPPSVLMGFIVRVFLGSEKARSNDAPGPQCCCSALRKADAVAA